MGFPCLGCGADLPLGAAFCNQCGRTTDADRDGIPDALGKAIEEKARVAVATERERVAQALLVAGAEAARAKALGELRVKEAQLEASMAAIDRLPTSTLGACWRTFVLALVIGFPVFGIFGGALHVALAALDASPAGLVCPLQCSRCHGPGRTFSWRYKGPWYSEKGRMGYALVCHGGPRDPADLSVADVRGSLNEELQPYMVHGFVAFLVEWAVFPPIVALAFGVFLGPTRPARWRRARRALEAQRAQIVAQRERMDPPAAVTFRA